MCSLFTEELPHLLAVLLPPIDLAGSHWKQLPAQSKSNGKFSEPATYGADAYLPLICLKYQHGVPTSARGCAIHHPPALALVLSTKENA